MNTENNIDLKSMSVNDLKALAYDCIAQKEEAERNLALVNQQIMIKMQSLQQQELQNVEVNHTEELEIK